MAKSLSFLQLPHVCKQQATWWMHHDHILLSCFIDFASLNFGANFHTLSCFCHFSSLAFSDILVFCVDVDELALFGEIPEVAVLSFALSCLERLRLLSLTLFGSACSAMTYCSLLDGEPKKLPLK